MESIAGLELILKQNLYFLLKNQFKYRQTK